MQPKALLCFGIVLILGLGELAFFVPVSFSQPQALTVFTGTGCFSYQTKGFGLDLPKITYCLSPSKFSYADNLNNFTLNIPKLSGQSLTLTELKNSTALEAQLTGTVAGHAANLNILWVQQKFNALVLIQGTISGLVGTLPLALPMVGSTSWSTGNTFVNIGHLAFDWSADSAVASWSNSTKTLTFNVGASVNIDPLALDNSVSRSCSVAAASCTTSAVVEGLNDVLIVVCINLASSDTFTAVTSSPSLTWHLRKSLSQTGLTLDESYAVATSSASYTFTCNVSPNSIMVMQAFGISGADPTPTFDPNGAVPCTGTGSGAPAQTTTCTLSTSNPNDFIFGLYATTNSITAFTPGGSFSTIIGTGARTASEYQIVSATQTNLAVTASTTAGNPTTWNAIGDAVEANNCCTSTTTTSTTTSATTTVTNNLGDPVSYLWLLTLPFVAVLFLVLRKKL